MTEPADHLAVGQVPTEARLAHREAISNPGPETDGVTDSEPEPARRCRPRPRRALCPLD